jgi:hypothetical protein
MKEKLVRMALKSQQKMPRVLPAIVQFMSPGNVIYKRGPNPRTGDRIRVKLVSG